MALWSAIARPPFLPKIEHQAAKLAWPNPFERRFWALVFSYALPAIAPGPILTMFSLYLNQGLGVSQSTSLAALDPAAGLGSRLLLLGLGGRSVCRSTTAGRSGCSSC